MDRSKHRTHHFVSKGWGFERWIVNNDKYCGKLLYFVEGKHCSLHYHVLKDEVFYVQSGRITVWYSDDLELMKASVGDRDLYSKMKHITLKKGDSFHVPPGRVHQMFAREDTELFEFSTQHFDEDSYRLIKGD